MDPLKWVRHASGEGKELDGVSLLIENFTLDGGPRFFVSFNDNAFIRRMDAKHGTPTNPNISSAWPETALVDRGDALRRAWHRIFTWKPIAALGRFLKEKKRLPVWFRILSWLHDFGSTKYYILRGDHRDAYERLVPQGFRACYRYFLERYDAGDGHFWGETPRERR